MKERVSAILGAAVLVLTGAIGATVGMVQTQKQEELQEERMQLAKEIQEIETPTPIIYVEVEEIKEAEPKEETVEDVYQADLELIARVVYAESGNQAFVGKVAVATTVINRAEAWGKTIESVVYEPNQYVVGDKTNDECRRAVEFAWANRDLYPSDMFWFTSVGYSYGYPYVHIGSHFFSTQEERRNK